MPMRMTREEAERVLFHMGDYIEWDEGYGPLFRAPLVDATLVAVKALREPQLEHGMWVRKTVKNRPGIDEVCCSRCMNVIGVVFSDTGFKECKSGMNFCNKCGSKMDAEGF